MKNVVVSSAPARERPDYKRVRELLQVSSGKCHPWRLRLLLTTRKSLQRLGCCPLATRLARAARERDAPVLMASVQTFRLRGNTRDGSACKWQLPPTGAEFARVRLSLLYLSCRRASPQLCCSRSSLSSGRISRRCCTTRQRRRAFRSQAMPSRSSSNQSRPHKRSPLSSTRPLMWMTFTSASPCSPSKFSRS